MRSCHTTYMRWALICAVAVLTSSCDAGAIPPDARPAQIDALPDDFVRTEFKLFLYRRFYENPEHFAFFGDVGPTAGCDALDQAVSEITARDLRAFRVEYIEAAKAALGPSELAMVEQRWLGVRLSSHPWYNGKINARLKGGNAPALGKASEELLRRIDQWAIANGYVGRRLGYNAASVPYWATNSAMPGLVCATPPAGRAALLRAWQE